MTILYDPNDFNELSVLYIWRGTIMPFVLGRPAIWLLLIAHIAFLCVSARVLSSLDCAGMSARGNLCALRESEVGGRSRAARGRVTVQWDVSREWSTEVDHAARGPERRAYRYSCGTPPQRQRAQRAAVR